MSTHVFGVLYQEGAFWCCSAHQQPALVEADVWWVRQSSPIESLGNVMARGAVSGQEIGQAVRRNQPLMQREAEDP